MSDYVRPDAASKDLTAHTFPSSEETDPEPSFNDAKLTTRLLKDL